MHRNISLLRHCARSQPARNSLRLLRDVLSALSEFFISNSTEAVFISVSTEAASSVFGPNPRLAKVLGPGGPRLAAMIVAIRLYKDLSSTGNVCMLFDILAPVTTGFACKSILGPALNGRGAENCVSDPL